MDMMMIIIRNEKNKISINNDDDWTRSSRSRFEHRHISMTNNPLEISSFYSHLSMMPTLINSPAKMPGNLYRPNSWMDPNMQPFFYYNLALNDPNHKRKNATRETTATLKAWLYEHRKNPYPTKNEKMVLAMVTKMTLTQVSTWFANARRRLKKENKLHRTTNNSKSEEDEEDDDDDDDDEQDQDDEDEKQDDEHHHHHQQHSAQLEQTNENERNSRVNLPQTPTPSHSHGNHLKRKRDENEEETKDFPPPASQRPKIWSLVDVVQSNETKRNPSVSLPGAPAPRMIHPFITPSIPYLFYPSSTVVGPSISTSSPSQSSEHSTHSLLSPISCTSSSSSSSTATSASCSPTK